MDRGLVGVLSIAMVLSTLTTLFIIGERAREDVTVLRNEFPGVVMPGEDDYRFLVKMITRRPLVRVEARYSLLDRVENGDVAYIEPGNRTGSTAEETLMNLAWVKRNIAQSEATGIEPETWTGSIEWKDVKYSEPYDLDVYLYDFTDLLRTATPNQSLEVVTTYMVWLYPANHTVHSVFRGIPDFFYNKQETVLDLTISHGNQTTQYKNPEEDPEIQGQPQDNNQQEEIEEEEEGEGEGGYRLIQNAPQLGTVVFNDMEKEDLLSITLTVKGKNLKHHNGMLQVVRIYADQELQTVLNNYIKP